MLHFLKSIVLGVIDALPNISSFILVLVGVIMSLPKLAEKIEDNKTARNTVAAVCVVLGFGGFLVGEIQRSQSKTQMSTLLTDADTLIRNTNTEVNNTNILVTTTGLLMPQVSSLNSYVADLHKQMEANKGNPQKLADLEIKEAAARQKADEANTQFLIALAPGIFGPLQELGSSWDYKDEQIANMGAARMGETTEQLATEYWHRVQPLMVPADNLRRQLLQRLKDSDQTQDNKDWGRSEAIVFENAMAGKRMHPVEVENAARYLSYLYSQVKLQLLTEPTVKTQ